MKKTLALMYGAAALVFGLGALVARDAAAEPPGPEVCKACHEAYFESFSHTVHGAKDNPRSPAANAGCSSCHGDGTKHVEAGGGRGVGGIINPGSKALSAEAKDKICLTCHEDIRALVMRPSHHPIVEGKVKCTSCHNPHGALSPAMVNAESIKEL